MLHDAQTDKERSRLRVAALFASMATDAADTIFDGTDETGPKRKMRADETGARSTVGDETGRRRTAGADEPGARRTAGDETEVPSDEIGRRRRAADETGRRRMAGDETAGLTRGGGGDTAGGSVVGDTAGGSAVWDTAGGSAVGDTAGGSTVGDTAGGSAARVFRRGPSFAKGSSMLVPAYTGSWVVSMVLHETAAER